MREYGMKMLYLLYRLRRGAVDMKTSWLARRQIVWDWGQIVRY
jgi:hypothetical protein